MLIVRITRRFLQTVAALTLLIGLMPNAHATLFQPGGLEEEYGDWENYSSSMNDAAELEWKLDPQCRDFNGFRNQVRNLLRGKVRDSNLDQASLYMACLARYESECGLRMENSKTSARGHFQFINRTWDGYAVSGCRSRGDRYNLACGVETTRRLLAQGHFSWWEAHPNARRCAGGSVSSSLFRR